MKRVNKSCSSYEDECNSMLKDAENRKKTCRGNENSSFNQLIPSQNQERNYFLNILNTAISYML